MGDIHIFYTSIEEIISNYSFDFYLKKLPRRIQGEILEYHNYQDRCLHLLGKILLLEALKMYEIPEEVIMRLKYNKYARPYIDGVFDFNISHSGKYVLCGFGKNIRLGVDIEKVKTIDVINFSNVMNAKQWERIMNSNDSKRTFFKYWTLKECIAKADGRGLSISLEDISIHNDDSGYYGGNYWYLTKLSVDNTYYASLATNRPAIPIMLHYVNIL